MGSHWSATLSKIARVYPVLRSWTGTVSLCLARSFHASRSRMLQQAVRRSEEITINAQKSAGLKRHRCIRMDFFDVYSFFAFGYVSSALYSGLVADIFGDAAWLRALV